MRVGPALRRRIRRAGSRGILKLPTNVRRPALTVASRVQGGPVVLMGPPPGPALVVAPHPDDEVIGPGGTVALHLAAGDDVTVLVVTSGDAGAGGQRDRSAIREQESCRALRHLGTPYAPHFARLADGTLQRSIDRVAQLIAEHGRDAAAIYVPTLWDPHPDHAAVATAAMSCGLDEDVLILGYEVWGAGPITALVDVTTVFARKQAALAEYTTALETVDYVRTASGLAAYRSSQGAMGGRGFAEGFVAMPLGEYRRLG
ncbi:PIG-L family deacetylase [soil metagenome]